MELPSALAGFVERFEQAWAAGDPAGLAALWDMSHPSPTYVAEEIEGVMIGVEQIRAYWAAVCERFTDIRVRLEPVACDLRENSAWLLGVGGFVGVRVADGSEVVSQDVRVGLLLRETADGWRVVHYIEAPRRAS